MLLNSLKTRVIISILGILIIALLGTTLSFGYRAKLEIADIYEDYAIEHRDMIRNFVDSQHDSIINYQSTMLNRRKIELQNNMKIVFILLDDIYTRVQAGEIGESAAKIEAIRIIQSIRINNDVGYFWINDTGQPYPRMIMHPTLTDLDGRILDDPEFDCALGNNENLFKAAVDICTTRGEGWVDYLWPKPTKDGLTERQPKLSFVKLFEPWNWILGTGVYIDDIDNDVQNKIDTVVQELNNTIALHGIGRSGYSFIFDENNWMLVHPGKSNTDGNLLINPATGERVLEELKIQALTPEKYLEYTWDKPGAEEQYLFPKRTFVIFYEPLRWYIGTTFYLEDFEERISNLTTKIILFSIFFLVIALLLALYVSGSITKPLNTLINAIKNTDENGIPLNIIPEAGTNEIELLSITMNKMLASISESRQELIKHQENLEILVSERTEELNKSLEELNITKDYLIQSEKMSALGNLVAGIAHEINTPIGIAVTAASHLEEKTADFNKTYRMDMLTHNDFDRYIDTALNSSRMLLTNMNRAAELITSFKRVAVDQSSENKRLFNVSQYIKEVLISLRPKLKKTAHILNIDCDENLEIISYPGAISQILTNLIMNSLTHGFKDIEAGKIDISIKANAEIITLVYHDNGIGIPSKNIKKVFDPFFTTNRSEGSSGLGLQIVYNIATQTLGGDIVCRNTTGHGAEFELTFKSHRKTTEEN